MLSTRTDDNSAKTSVSIVARLVNNPSLTRTKSADPRPNFLDDLQKATRRGLPQQRVLPELGRGRTIILELDRHSIRGQDRLDDLVYEDLILVFEL